MIKINLFSKKILLIKIQEKTIIISQLIDQNDKYKLFNTQKIALDNLETLDNKLFNFSQIFLIVKTYLNYFKIKKAKAIITLEKAPTDLMLLQIVLLISKTGLKIAKIINLNNLTKDDNMLNFLNKKEIDNNLDFFKQFEKPNKKINIFYFFIILLFTSIEIIFFSETLKQKNISIKNLETQINTISLQTQTIKKELKIKQDLTAKNEILAKNIKKIELHKIKNQKLYSILSSLPQILPKQTKLTKIAFDKNAKHKKQLLLLGQSLKQEEISIFAQNLEKNINFKKVKLLNIQKEKKAALESVYNFKINCLIKSQ